MKKLLNSLYVTTPGAYLSKESETVCISIESRPKVKLPLQALDSIVCFGSVGCTPDLMGACAANDVSISFLTDYGRFLAKVQGPVAGNVLLRREQYRKADNSEIAADVARNCIAAKLTNCRNILLRAQREQNDSLIAGEIMEGVDYLANSIRDLKFRDSVDSIRGIEGDGARQYFALFDHLIIAQKDHFKFKGRSRRPPLDPTNTLLSFYYTILAHDVRSALETVGLDPDVGYLHTDRPGRPGLALDLMEELRPYMVDRLVLSLINRRQVRNADFEITQSGACYLTDEARKEILAAYQRRKQETIQHPFLNEKISIGLVPHVQAMLFARYIRGDMEDYPPFYWK